MPDGTTWDKLAGMSPDEIRDKDLFPAGVSREDIDFYKTRQNRYGLPLDSRASYTKLDWIAWTATLTGDMEDFTTFILPVYRWANETSSRVPLTDWYDTIDGRQRGFQARSVVGGLYMKMLMDRSLPRKQ